MKGIDVSKYQPSIDFKKVKAAGIDVVIIKATEGKSYKDPYFKSHYQGAKANGLKVGAYHFLRGNAAEDEVNNFLAAVKGLNLDCKLVIDAETDLGGVEATSRQVKAFKESLVAKGYEVVLYTGEYFYNNKLNSSVKDIPLWVAKYSTRKPNVGKSYIGWQYTSSGSVDGIAGRVDMNDFSEGILLSSPVKEEVKVKDLVVYGNLIDRRAAEYLADFLKCPTIDGSIPYDYSNVENVVCVGGPPENGWTSYAKKVITGTDRFDTVIEVLKFIGKL